MIAQAQLEDQLARLGVATGDVLLVHSSLKSVGPIEGGADTLLHALRTVLGTQGALVLPTFTVDTYCADRVFDVRDTPGQTGILGNILRSVPGVTRTWHPLYSVAVQGRGYLVTRDHCGGSSPWATAYGKDSIFATLVACHARILVVGLPYNNSLTLIHHAEHLAGALWRYSKEFPGTRIQPNGTTELVAPSMYVRKRGEGVVTDIEPLGAWLEAEGVVTTGAVGQAECRLMRAEVALAWMLLAVYTKPYLCYRHDAVEAVTHAHN